MSCWGWSSLTPQFFPKAKEVLEILRIHAQIPLLAGCSSNGLIAGAREVEKHAGLVLALHHLPGAELLHKISED